MLIDTNARRAVEQADSELAESSSALTDNCITKFNLDDQDSIKEYFHEQGYVVIRQAIHNDKIDKFLAVYESIGNHPLFIYYSQSLHVAMRPQFNKYNFMQESMQNGSRLAFFKEFCRYYQSCIYDESVSQALTILDGEEKHVSRQNMFFDQSTGTIEHQDSWYLDTEPAGNLIGVWFALENIELNSGTFFVIPKSHNLGLIDRAEFPQHSDFVNEIFKKIDELNLQKKPMALNKGDILLWHPFLVHGAFSCQDESLSRKSFTSHFYPYGFKAKDVEKGKILSVYNHEQPKTTMNPNIYSSFKFNDYFYNILLYGLYIKDKFMSVKKSLSMRREDYISN